MLKTQIEISKLQPGMTVLFRGKITDVAASDLGFDSFGCQTFKGDSTKKVLTRVQFEVPIGRVRLVGDSGHTGGPTITL